MRKPCGPAHVLGHQLGIERAEPVGRPILAGQDGVNAGHLLRRSFVDGADARMGMRRKHEDRVRLASEIDVGDIASLPGQEPAVFLAGHRLSDAEAHVAPSFRRGPAAYDKTAAISSREKPDISSLPVVGVSPVVSQKLRAVQRLRAERKVIQGKDRSGRRRRSSDPQRIVVSGGFRPSRNVLSPTARSGPCKSCCYGAGQISLGDPGAHDRRMARKCWTNGTGT